MRFDSNVVPKLSWTKKSDGFCAEEAVLCKMKAGPSKIRCFLFEEETSGNKWCSENEFMKKKGRELMVMGRGGMCCYRFVIWDVLFRDTKSWHSKTFEKFPESFSLLTVISIFLKPVGTKDIYPPAVVWWFR